jgi:MATE family multidrug resistance protein
MSVFSLKMNKQILNLAVPNIITNITVPLLGMVDSAIAGHLESGLYIGAIAIASSAFNFIYWPFSFLRMGTSGFTAQAYGARNGKEVVHNLMRSLCVALCAGFIILLLQYVLLKVVFMFFHTGGLTRIYISSYFLIYIWAAPFVLCMYAVGGWFIGMQDAKTPMFISISTNIINIFLSFIFVFGFDMSIKGLALGTLFAQLAGFFIALFILIRKYGYLKKFISWDFIKNIAGFKSFFKVNADMLLRSLGLIAVTIFFTSASSKMGEAALGANALLMQFFILFSYIIDGFAYAAEALAGKYYGAKDYRNFFAVTAHIFAWGFVIAVIFTLFYIVFADNILSVFTDKKDIIAVAKKFKIWVLFIPAAGFGAFLWDGIFVAMTASKYMRNSMIISVGVFFAVYAGLLPALGNNALWLAFIIYLFTRGFVQTFLFIKAELF